MFPRVFIQILFILSFVLLENFVSYQANLKTHSGNSKINVKDLIMVTKGHWNGQRNLTSASQIYRYKIKRSVRKNNGRKRIRPISDSDKSSSSMSKNSMRQLADENYGDPCVTDPCRHGGTCIWRKNRVPSYTCTCRLGYTGRRCQKALPECDKGPCRQHGDCIATEKGFVCRCTDGYEGRTCEIRKTNNAHGRNTGESQIVLTKDQVVEIEYVSAIVTGSIFISCLIFCVHCFKVYVRRTLQYQLYEQRLTEGNVPTSLPPGLIDTSNQICCETFCCRNPNGVEVIEKASKHERTKTKKTKSKHKRKRSEYSVSPELKIQRSRASRRESRIQENLSRPISRQFQSVPSVLSHPQQHLSWMNTEGVERESESSRLLPKPGYSTSGHNTRPSEILNAHRMSNERIRQMDNNDNDAFAKRQISTSQTEHPSAAFSQHSALSEPHRSLILPPLPPFPPPPLDLRD